MSAEIQLDMFATAPAVEDGAIELMRPHKWAHGPMGSLALVRVEVVPYGDRWMWSASLCSANGAGQGSKALPKWGKFAPTRLEAVQHAVDEVQEFAHRATTEERARIADWLGCLLSATIHNRHESPNGKQDTNRRPRRDITQPRSSVCS